MFYHTFILSVICCLWPITTTAGDIADTVAGKTVPASTELLSSPILDLTTLHSNLDEINVVTHQGGSIMDTEQVKKCINEVLTTLPNIKPTKELKQLIYETMITETNLGETDFRKGNKSGNYGVGQFTLSTAKYMVGWLRKNDKLTHTVLMKYYDKDKSLKHNVTYNVSFSIGLMAQYYLHREPKLYQKIQCIDARAKLWKRVYNTYKGTGSPSTYKRRVNQFKKVIQNA